MSKDTLVYDKVKDYYGHTVQSTEDLATNACTTDRTAVNSAVKEALRLIHPEIKQKNYGCGAVIPEGVEGSSVLDLGSGAGLDCYVLSKLVGEDGRVVGVDMTKEQLDVARKHIDYHTQKFGYSHPNVEFREGYIECLDKAGIQSGVFDFIVSNCVVNLSPDKTAVLKEAYRVLKPGGQLYFSDIYTNQEMPQVLKKNKVLWGECLSGALQWTDLVQLAVDIGFAPPILVKSVVLTNDSDKVNEMLVSAGAPDLKFCSATYRLVKTDWDRNLTEDPLVDVQYRGTLKGHEKSVKFSYVGELSTDTKVPMPSSTAQLITKLPLDVTILGPSTSTVSTHPSLSGFLSVDPFEVASGTLPMATPKGMCGEDPSGSSGCGSSKSCCSWVNSKLAC